MVGSVVWSISAKSTVSKEAVSILSISETGLLGLLIISNGVHREVAGVVNPKFEVPEAVLPSFGTKEMDKRSR
jgi:hypothetical protein